RPEEPHPAPRQPHFSDRQRPARPDPVARQGGQDDGAQEHRARDRRELPGDASDGGAHRRAARRGDGHEPVRQGRDLRVDLRRAYREPHPGRRDGPRDRQAPGRDRPRRGDPARLDHAAGAGLQPGAAGQRQDALRWRRPGGPLSAQAVLRRGAQRGARRIADDHRDLSGGHRLADGRRDLRGVQGNRQHGARARSQALREAHLPGHRRPPLRHPPRGAAPRREQPADGVDHAPHAQRPRPQRGDRAAHAAPWQDDEQLRVPRLPLEVGGGLRALTRAASRRGLIVALSAALLVAGCTLAEPTPSSSSAQSAQPSQPSTAQATSSRGVGQVIAAPGSTSEVYRPNPAAIVVAIDPGHGGCLDWGVPNPYDNKVAKSEKADTLGIALALRDLLTAQGVTVVLTRTDDSALAGDLYPALGCHGAPFRDVNGDGITGFGPGVPEATRTRDELSARIDLSNLARADVFISIHINSMTENGVLYKIAASQTFYTDAFAWAAAS